MLKSTRQNLCLKVESLTLEPDSFYNSPAHDLAEKHLPGQCADKEEATYVFSWTLSVACKSPV